MLCELYIDEMGRSSPSLGTGRGRRRGGCTRGMVFGGRRGGFMQGMVLTVGGGRPVFFLAVVFVRAIVLEEMGIQHCEYYCGLYSI